MTPIDTAIQSHAVMLISIVLAFGGGWLCAELRCASRNAQREAAKEEAELAKIEARYRQLRKERTDRPRRAIPSRMGADGIPAAERIGVAHRVARLNPEAGEIGPGMLRNIVAAARQEIGEAQP